MIIKKQEKDDEKEELAFNYYMMKLAKCFQALY